MLQPLGSSKREVSKEAIISHRRHHGANRRKISSSLKAQKMNSPGLFALPSIRMKMNFVLSSRELSWIST